MQRPREEQSRRQVAPCSLQTEGSSSPQAFPSTSRKTCHVNFQQLQDVSYICVGTAWGNSLIRSLKRFQPWPRELRLGRSSRSRGAYRGEGLHCDLLCGLGSSRWAGGGASRREEGAGPRGGAVPASIGESGAARARRRLKRGLRAQRERGLRGLWQELSFGFSARELTFLMGANSAPPMPGDRAILRGVGGGGCTQKQNTDTTYLQRASW